nr:immunoglobulin heavy chain junction region [Macaca mulatta]MOW32594.1 immunoglobulin heavy chain junction region [Macaca mulatta]MOW32763.1 immunoglobulin heavy chain junction region [Macaca mulatta]MOW32950.1 immunoglobulin heavy chain junction region [Macaca mulatta]MOW33017.1 immunoglobulin heavy chain junction region [Macaca mulatta]
CVRDGGIISYNRFDVW